MLKGNAKTWRKQKVMNVVQIQSERPCTEGCRSNLAHGVPLSLNCLFCRSPTGNISHSQSAQHEESDRIKRLLIVFQLLLAKFWKWTNMKMWQKERSADCFFCIPHMRKASEAHKNLREFFTFSPVNIKICGTIATLSHTVSTIGRWLNHKKEGLLITHFIITVTITLWWKVINERKARCKHIHFGRQLIYSIHSGKRDRKKENETKDLEALYPL